MCVDTSDSDFSTVKKTGGEKTHQLTADEMWTNGFASLDTGKTQELWCVGEIKTYGSGSYKIERASFSRGAHNNLQPYMTVYIWQRTA